MRGYAIRTVFKRDFHGYFANPTGYIFITVFVLLSALAAFVQDRFFASNLANLEPLNRWFPYLLLVFIPTITMATWAEERKRGTDELLLTLPVSDAELLLGKYLAAVGVYGVSLAFSLSHIVVLVCLGKPDMGVMLGTYLGYAFLGAAMIAVAMAGSFLSSNQTVAFILGALFCAVPVFLNDVGLLVGDPLERWLAAYGVWDHFRDFTSGMMTLEAVLFFAGLIAVLLYVNSALLGRRHMTQSSQKSHSIVRAAALLAAFVSLTILGGRTRARADVTSEQLHSLSKETLEVLRKLSPEKPVYVQAFVSPEVPRAYIETRENLLALLRQYDAMGAGRIRLKVHQTDRYSSAAREAQEKFGIRPEKLMSSEEGRAQPQDIFLGVAFTCGAEETILPFLYKGLSVEYELTRSLRVVSGESRKRVGILSTDAKLWGGFNFENMSSTQPWPIVTELRKQYKVEEASPEQPISESLDVLLVAMPSSLTQPQMDRVKEYVLKGKPTLILDDPLPLFNPSLAPTKPKSSGRRGMFGPEPGNEAKGDIGKFMQEIGLQWPTSDVVWDTYNPHPHLQHLPPEFVFVGTRSGSTEPFNRSDATSSGLQEVVLLGSGHLAPVQGQEGGFIPLLRSTRRSGTLPSGEVLREGIFGLPGGWNEERVHYPTGKEHVLAAWIRRAAQTTPQGNGSSSNPLKVLMIADVDFVHEQFFEIRREGIEDLQFDNITFILNAVDVASGDEAFVELRKRRPKHRTLEAVEARVLEHEEKQLQERRAAEAAAERKKGEAQDRLNAKVNALRQRTDLDERSKQLKLQELEEVENRRLEVTKGTIDDEKNAAIERSKETLELSVRRIQRQIKWLALLLPPIPALAIGIIVFLRRLRFERAAGRITG